MTTVARVRTYSAEYIGRSMFSSLFLKGIRVVAAKRSGWVLARMTAEQIHCSNTGLLISAVQNAIIIWAGMMAVAAHTGTESNARGWSKTFGNVHFTYVAEMSAGDEVEIEASLDCVTPEKAYLSVVLRKCERPAGRGWDETKTTDGPVCAIGRAELSVYPRKDSRRNERGEDRRPKEPARLSSSGGPGSPPQDTDQLGHPKAGWGG